MQNLNNTNSDWKIQYDQCYQLKNNNKRIIIVDNLTKK